MTRTPLTRLALALVAALAALVVAPTAVAHNQWNATTEFRSSPSQENPSRDHHGNLGVWNYMTGTIAATRDPTTYALMPNFAATATQQTWRPATSDGFDTPAIWLNTTVTAFEVHPSGLRYAIAAWKSPISGSVTISGSFTDADGGCGDGINWFIDKGAANLTSGSYANGGSQTFSTTATVATGDVVYFIVGPGTANDFLCDSTFADLSVTGPADVAVRMVGLSARQTSGGVLVRWRTAFEADLAGFSVYRDLNGRRVRLNSRLIAAAGGNRGHSYSLLDRRAPRSPRYWIQAVGLDGSRTWFGPARASPGRRQR